MTLSSVHSEHWLHTGATFSLPVNWHGLCALRFSSILCAFDCDGNLTHTLTFRDADTCATRSWSLCTHLCANTLRSLVPLLSLVLAFVYLCSFMDGMQMPPGITECNHSYFSSNSFSAPHLAQQLQNGTIATLVQPLASIQEVNGAASSSFVSSSLLSRSAISSQVTTDPTRNGTGDVMPLAEAITQLSFLEFLQRCGVSIAPPQPSQPPVPISLQDATVQTTPPCDVS